MISIVNAYKYKGEPCPIYVGRASSFAKAKSLIPSLRDGSCFGNPYAVASSSRDEVCDRYAAEFAQFIVKPEVAQKWEKLLEWVRGGKDLTLVCWCAPQRCHAATIKEALCNSI